MRKLIIIAFAAGAAAFPVAATAENPPDAADQKVAADKQKIAADKQQIQLLGVRVNNSAAAADRRAPSSGR